MKSEISYEKNIYPFILFIFLSLILLFPLSLQAHHANIKFEHFTIAQGLSQNCIYGIAQDKYGFLWFGTMDGLNRFDGYSFKIYQHDKNNPNSLSDDFINFIHKGRSGHLWIGTASGFTCFDPKSETFKTAMKIAAKNAKDREEKEKKFLVTWCLGGKVFMVFG